MARRRAYKSLLHFVKDVLADNVTDPDDVLVRVDNDRIYIFRMNGSDDADDWDELCIDNGPDDLFIPLLELLGINAEGV